MLSALAPRLTQKAGPRDSERPRDIGQGIPPHSRRLQEFHGEALLGLIYVNAVQSNASCDA